jgi:hypothetical protein
VMLSAMPLAVADLTKSRREILIVLHSNCGNLFGQSDIPTAPLVW